MTGDVIKSFMVGLGFEVDDSSLAKFNKAITNATLKVTALYAGVQVAAAAIGYSITQVSEDFEKMGYEFRLIAPAINKTLVLRRELLRAYSEAGVNILKVVQSSVKLNMSLAKTRFAFKALYDSVASRFFGFITRQSDIFREKLYKAMPKIQNVLEHLIKFVFNALEAAVHLGSTLWSILTRVYDFFDKLDKVTGGWSTTIIAIIAAWKLLNLSFLATPLGLLLSLGLAVLALYDDFKTFREGGQSLINWGSDFTKTLVGVAAVIATISTVTLATVAAFKLWTAATEAQSIAQGILNVITNANPILRIVGIITTLIGLIALLDEKFIHSHFFSWIGGKVLDFFGGGNVGSNTQNTTPAGAPPIPPIGPATQNNSQRNSTVNQQNSLTVNSQNPAHDAPQLYDSFSKINFDMTRNLGNINGVNR